MARSCIASCGDLDRVAPTHLAHVDVLACASATRVAPTTATSVTPPPPISVHRAPNVSPTQPMTGAPDGRAAHQDHHVERHRPGRGCRVDGQLHDGLQRVEHRDRADPHDRQPQRRTSSTSASARPRSRRRANDDRGQHEDEPPRLARRAASSAPASDPIAMIEPSMPYSPAPLWKTPVAISAVVIWKFMPERAGDERDDEDEDQVGSAHARSGHPSRNAPLAFARRAASTAQLAASHRLQRADHREVAHRVEQDRPTGRLDARAERGDHEARRGRDRRCGRR